MKQRCIVLIDGSNFYFKLKDLELHNLLTFDFGKFVKLLGRSQTIANACYYVGRIRQDGTALAPAIKKAREKGKIVEYIGFSHKPSVAMVSFCSESRLLTKEDFIPFVKSDK